MSLLGGFLVAPAATAFAMAAEVVAASTDVQFVVVLSCGGDAVVLTDPYRLLTDTEGFDDIEGTPVTQAYTALDGESYAGMAYAGRDVFLNLAITAETGEAWEACRKALRTVVNPRKGLTTVSVVRPDGTTRTVTGPAVTRGGAWTVDGWSVNGYQRLGVLVRALSSWWATDGAVGWSWSGATPSSWFDGDFDLRTLAPDSTAGAPILVEVPGDVETYPTVIIDGPATTVQVSDPATGRSWTVDCTGLTMPVTVVTEPTASAVTDATGADRWTALAAGADLWPLQPGMQQVLITAAGTNASTTVTGRAPAAYFAAVA